MKQTLPPYIRDVKYYETDQMAIAHHSNYIRWFEEARLDYMEKMGFPYIKMEEYGILSPVLSVSCEYRQAVRFGTWLEIYCKLTSFNGIRMILNYEVRGQANGILHATGTSSHCFVTKELKPLSLKKSLPEAYNIFITSINH